MDVTREKKNEHRWRSQVGRCAALPFPTLPAIFFFSLSHVILIREGSGGTGGKPDENWCDPHLPERRIKEGNAVSVLILRMLKEPVLTCIQDR